MILLRAGIFYNCKIGILEEGTTPITRNWERDNRNHGQELPLCGKVGDINKKRGRRVTKTTTIYSHTQPHIRWEGELINGMVRGQSVVPCWLLRKTHGGSSFLQIQGEVIEVSAQTQLISYTTVNDWVIVTKEVAGTDQQWHCQKC